MSGKIEVITGPMFSGKTVDLIRKMDRFKYSKKEYILFKPKVDDRYSKDEVVSHNKNALSAYNVSTSDEILEICQRYPQITNIGLDEVQFLDEKNPEKFLPNIIKLRNAGYHIIAAGLDMDYLGNPFSFMPNLLAIADQVFKLKAVCFECGEDAGMSNRISKSKKIVQLGSEDKYSSLCFSCWIKVNPPNE
jgi:thymidine kinase